MPMTKLDLYKLIDKSMFSSGKRNEAKTLIINADLNNDDLGVLEYELSKSSYISDSNKLEMIKAVAEAANKRTTMATLTSINEAKKAELKEQIDAMKQQEKDAAFGRDVQNVISLLSDLFTK